MSEPLYQRANLIHPTLPYIVSDTSIDKIILFSLYMAYKDRWSEGLFSPVSKYIRARSILPLRESFSVQLDAHRTNGPDTRRIESAIYRTTGSPIMQQRARRVR
jgi:hypothetical protein